MELRDREKGRWRGKRKERGLGGDREKGPQVSISPVGTKALPQAQHSPPTGQGAGRGHVQLQLPRSRPDQDL